jgi:HPt (histidine-containing phosphotransfer) domain-containing protein
VSSEPRVQLTAKLAELAQRYLRRTADEVVAIRAAVERYAGGDLNALREIERAAHRIRGSGGMFGFNAVGDAASEIEIAAGGDVKAEQLRPLAEKLDAQIHAALRANGQAS